MKLEMMFGLDRENIISVIGAGGKTSFIFFLAEQLSLKNKVLITTTTKIYFPKPEQYDLIGINYNGCLVNEIISRTGAGRYIIGGSINEENKITCLDGAAISNQESNFDYILIEADGSKGRPLKGWNESEPVIYKGTKNTIGIIDIKAVGKIAQENNVHRLDRFKELTGINTGEKIECHHLKTIILHKKGMFKNAVGKKTLLINKVESKADIASANRLAELIVRENNMKLDRIIIGSIKERQFELKFSLDN